MRVRKRSGAEELIASYPQYVVDEPQKWKGRWTERFGNDQPIHIENICLLLHHNSWY